MIQRTILIGCLVVLVSSTAWGKDNADEQTPGLAIGKPAPQFSLPDQDGKLHSLESSIADQPSVAIVFHRSADW